MDITFEYIEPKNKEASKESFSRGVQGTRQNIPLVGRGRPIQKSSQNIPLVGRGKALQGNKDRSLISQDSSSRFRVADRRQNVMSNFNDYHVNPAVNTMINAAIEFRKMYDIAVSELQMFESLSIELATLGKKRIESAAKSQEIILRYNVDDLIRPKSGCGDSRFCESKQSILNLPIPIPHPKYYKNKTLINILNVICTNPKCEKRGNPKGDMKELMESKSSFGKNFKYFLAHLSDKYSKVKCNKCQHDVLVYTNHEDQGGLIMEGNGKRSFSIKNTLDIYNILEDSKKETCSFFEFKDSDLTTLMVKTMILPSYRFRPTSIRNGEEIKDPKTTAIINIITACSKYSNEGNNSIKEIYSKVSDYMDLVKGLVDGKKGLVRSAILGRKGRQCARSVVVCGDGELEADEIGIPIEMASEIPPSERVTSENFERIIELNRKGRIKKYISGDDPSKTVKTIVPTIDYFPKIGDKVYRWLENGDYVAFGRQPSLHANSLISAKVRIIEDPLQKTIKIGIPYTYGLNADFDGDEISIYASSDKNSLYDLISLMTPEKNVVSSEGSEPVIVPNFNTVTSSYMFTKEGVKIDEQMFSEALFKTVYKDGTFQDGTYHIIDSNEKNSNLYFYGEYGQRIDVDNDYASQVQTESDLGSEGIFRKMKEYITQLDRLRDSGSEDFAEMRRLSSLIEIYKGRLDYLIWMEKYKIDHRRNKGFYGYLKEYGIDYDSGIALFSSILPPTLFIGSIDESFFISNGILRKGRITSSRLREIVKQISIDPMLGNSRALRWVGDITNICFIYNQRIALTVSILDNLPMIYLKALEKKFDEEGVDREEDKSYYTKILREKEKIIKEYKDYEDMIESLSLSGASDEDIENAIDKNIDLLNISSLRLITDHVDKESPYSLMSSGIGSGSKGNIGNSAQIISGGFQQYVKGSIITNSTKMNRSLLSVLPGVNTMESRGTVAQSYSDGIGLTSYWTSAMSARSKVTESGINSLSITGSSQRTLAKSTENYVNYPDGSVASPSSIIQLTSGQDNIDQKKIFKIYEQGKEMHETFINMKNICSKINFNYIDSTPKPFTKRMIEDIKTMAFSIPFNGFDEVTSEVIKRNVLRDIEYQLSTLSIVHIDGIAEIISKIIRDAYKSSLETKSYPLGIRMSEGLSSVLMQASLNVHKRLTKKGEGDDSGLKYITQIFSASEDRKELAFMNVHFKPITYRDSKGELITKRIDSRDVFDMESIIIEYKYSDFLSEERSPELIVTTDDERNMIYGKDLAHIRLCSICEGEKLFESEYGRRSVYKIRLYLDPVKMIRNRMRMSSFCYELNNSIVAAITKKGKPCRLDPKVIPSSIKDGIVDIYINDIYDDDKEKNNELFESIRKYNKAKHKEVVDSVDNEYQINDTGDITISSFIFTSLLQPLMQGEVLKGMTGITGMKPVIENITSIFRKIRKSTDTEIDIHDLKREKKQLWTIYIDNDAIINKGIELDRALEILSTLGCKIMSRKKTVFREHIESRYMEKYKISEKKASVMFDKYEKKNNMMPSWEYMIVSSEGEDLRKKIEKWNEENDKNESVSKYVYAVTAGTNLSEISKLRFIDATKTTSNKSCEMLRVFGIESARKCTLNDLFRAFSSSNTRILYRHYELLMDHMFHHVIYKGKEKKLSVIDSGGSGITYSNESFTTKASHASPFETFFKMAPQNPVALSGEISAHTFTGRPANVGHNAHYATGAKRDKELENDKIKAINKAKVIASGIPNGKMTPFEFMKLVRDNSSINYDMNKKIKESILKPKGLKSKEDDDFDAPVSARASSDSARASSDQDKGSKPRNRIPDIGLKLPKRDTVRKPQIGRKEPEKTVLNSNISFINRAIYNALSENTVKVNVKIYSYMVRDRMKTLFGTIESLKTTSSDLGIEPFFLEEYLELDNGMHYVKLYEQKLEENTSDQYIEDEKSEEDIIEIEDLDMIPTITYQDIKNVKINPLYSHSLIRK